MIELSLKSQNVSLPEWGEEIAVGALPHGRGGLVVVGRVAVTTFLKHSSYTSTIKF